jgi:redox-sensitive bicupin YhaK (pirin superfamily)
MIKLRKATDRARSRTDWLDSWHSFSFAQHHDPEHMGHGPLRVINEDWIAPLSGFPLHPHRDMEILTYMLSGTLTHRDSEGNAVEITRGKLQRMQAGLGIVHSEINMHPTEPVHLLQVWLEPDRPGVEPRHDELDFELAPGERHVLASGGHYTGGLAIAQNAQISALVLDAGSTTELPFSAERQGWVQAVQGAGRLAEQNFDTGDGLQVETAGELTLAATTDLEVLIFYLP